MSWRKPIVAALSADTSLVALVGSRIFPEVAPDDTKAPFLVFAEVSQAPTVSHDGDDGLDSTAIQVTAWASSQDSARAIRSAVRARLSGLAPGGSVVGPLVPQSPRVLRDDHSRLFGAIIEFSFGVDPSQA